MGQVLRDGGIRHPATTTQLNRLKSRSIRPNIDKKENIITLIHVFIMAQEWCYD